MRTLLLSIIALICAALPAAANELLIIQSQHREVYDQAVRLIQNSCGNGSEPMVMGDYAEFDLGRIVREEQPRLVVAIGEQAFKEARKLRRTAVVYSHTLNVDENRLGDNIIGVSMHVAPENYARLFKKLHLRRVAVLFDPRRSGAYLQRAHQAFARAGIELVAVEVSSPREVPAALARLKSHRINGIWLIPDSTAIAPESVDAYFHYAQQQNLPVISFAKGYLSKGAVAVLEGTRTSIADQSCALIGRIRGGAALAELATVDISEANLSINKELASRLQLHLPKLPEVFQTDGE